MSLEETHILTDKEVENLNKFQQEGKYHPFTCPYDGDEKHCLEEFVKKFNIPKENYSVETLKDAYALYIEDNKAKGIPYPEQEFKETSLIATKSGWVCPCCNYTQNWAHDFMKTF